MGRPGTELLRRPCPNCRCSTRRLADSLADENALAAVPSVSSAFDELVLAHKKEVYVTIVTAHVGVRPDGGEKPGQAQQLLQLAGTASEPAAQNRVGVMHMQQWLAGLLGLLV